MDVNLEPRAPGVVHEEQAGAIVGREVACADVLAIATIVGKGECAVIHQLEEAARASAVLNVRPARLRDRRHVETVTVGDEGDFAIGEAVEVAVPLEVLPERSAPILACTARTLGVTAISRNP